VESARPQAFIASLEAFLKARSDAAGPSNAPALGMPQGFSQGADAGAVTTQSPPSNPPGAFWTQPNASGGATPFAAPPSGTVPAGSYLFGTASVTYTVGADTVANEPPVPPGALPPGVTTGTTGTTGPTGTTGTTGTTASASDRSLRSLRYGMVVDAVLSARDGQDAERRWQAGYKFQGAADDSVVVEMSSGAFAPAVRVLQPDGTALPGTADPTRSLLVWNLPAKGAYRILASARQPDRGGAYRLRLGALSLGPQEQGPDGPLPTFNDFTAGPSATGTMAGAALEVSLPDGTRVVIPAGALPSGASVALRRLLAPPGERPQATVTVIDAGTAQLSADATVTLPCPSGPAGATFKVFRIDGDTVQEVPARHDAARGTVTVATRRFSAWLVVPVVIWLTTGSANDSLSEFQAEIGADQRAPITVPHYFQEFSLWCWAGATQMMLKAHGKAREIWDIARDAKAPYVERFPKSPEHSHVRGWLMGQHSDFTIDMDRLPYTDLFACARHVVGHLKAGRPVYLNVCGIQHAVVAVGFNRDGLWVHDPGGTVLTKMPSLKNTNYMQVWQQFRHAAIFVPWSDFFAMASRRLGWVCTLAATDRLPSASPITVQLLPKTMLRFEHPKSEPHRYFFMNFEWDGTHENGYKLAPNVEGDFPGHATNSDVMHLKVHLANASAAPATADVVVSWDGREVMRKSLPLTAGGPPYFTLNELEFADFKMGDAGLVPGPHVLKVDAGVDALEVKVNVGPSQPAGVRFEQRDRDVVMKWSAVPESGVRYEVRAAIGTLENTEVLGTVDATELIIPPQYAERPETRFFVTAIHTASGLAGSLSDYVPLGKKPEVTIEAPANNDQVTDSVVTVRGTVKGTKDGKAGGQPIDKAVVTVGSECYEVAVSGERFEQRVVVKKGDNTITARAENFVGITEANVLVKANIDETFLLIKMTWGGGGTDVDLHVIDPEGKITGFSDPIRPGVRVDGRRVDIDDTSGPGVEVYAITTLKPGTYKVRLNYYRGDNPEAVQVEYVTHPGTPQESKGTVNASLAKGDGNRGVGGANHHFEITLPARAACTCRPLSARTAFSAVGC